MFSGSSKLYHNFFPQKPKPHTQNKKSDPWSKHELDSLTCKEPIWDKMDHMQSKKCKKTEKHILNF